MNPNRRRFCTMPSITTCPKCGKCYEEVSEDMASSNERLCRACYEKHRGGALALPDDWYPSEGGQQ